MIQKNMKRALLLVTLAATVALGGCIVAPYPGYGYGYGGGYYRPHYWWRG